MYASCKSFKAQAHTLVTNTVAEGNLHHFQEPLPPNEAPFLQIEAVETNGECLFLVHVFVKNIFSPLFLRKIVSIGLTLKESKRTAIGIGKKKNMLTRTKGT